jgi:hypothetical protein
MLSVHQLLNLIVVISVFYCQHYHIIIIIKKSESWYIHTSAVSGKDRLHNALLVVAL